MIPTHSVLKLYHDLEMLDEPRDLTKTLPSLKSMLDAKIEKETEGMEDTKEKAGKARQMRQELYAMMDEQLRPRAHHFLYYLECNDMDSYWNSWSIAVEKAWLRYLGANKEFEKVAK